MKIKLLVVPSIIASIIILSIWVVYPAYSNGMTGVKDNYNKLKIEQAKLDSLRGKSGNVGKFISQLDALSEDRGIVSAFVPEEIKESEIVDNLNKMASDSGLLIFGISISQPEKEEAAEAALETMGGASLNFQSADASGAANIPVAALPAAKSFKTVMDVSGNYGQIKDFLNKVNGFARYGSVSNLSLRNAEENSGEEAKKAPGATPALLASITLEFNMLKKTVLSASNVDDPVFSSGSLNTQVIAKIKEQYNINALALEVGQKGKGDLFVP